MEKVHIISSLETGGAENYLLELISHESLGNTCILLLKNSISEINSNQIRLKGLKVFALFSVEGYNVLKHSKVIYAWMYHAILVSILYSGDRTICMVRQNEFSHKDPLRTKFIARVVLSYLVRFAAGLVYVSKQSQKTHKKLGWKNTNQVVIDNGYKMMDKKNLLGIKHIGFIARDHPIKRFDLFKKISEIEFESSNFVFEVYGAGYDSLKSICPNVNFYGEKNKETIYANIDLVLILSDSEGNSNVLVEGILAGCIVLSTNTGNASDILTPELLISQDLSEIKAKLLDVRKNFDRYKRLCELARDKIQMNYSLSEKYKELNSFTKKCVEL